nr:hypothetical protein [Tanacetum cinerariifolium]
KHIRHPHIKLHQWFQSPTFDSKIEKLVGVEDHVAFVVDGMW